LPPPAKILVFAFFSVGSSNICQRAGCSRRRRNCRQRNLVGLRTDDDLVANLFFMLVDGVTFVFLTSHLLQWIISNPTWLNLNSPLVKSGLNFTQAFAQHAADNRLFGDCLGFIFKVETFQSKKALPKFFLVAILSNFAPVFVRMIVDISTVINNTLIIGNQSAISGAFNVLITTTVQSIESILSFVVVQAGLTAIPDPVSTIAQVTAIGWFGAKILPVLPIYMTSILFRSWSASPDDIYCVFHVADLYVAIHHHSLAPGRGSLGPAANKTLF